LRANFLHYFIFENESGGDFTVNSAAAISELVIANRIVAQLKLAVSSAHITVRNPENPQRSHVTSTRASPAFPGNNRKFV
jgi:hypothetical protein